MQCSAVPCILIYCSISHCNPTQDNTFPNNCNTSQYNTVPLHSYTLLSSTIYSPIQQPGGSFKCLNSVSVSILGDYDKSDKIFYFDPILPQEQEVRWGLINIFIFITINISEYLDSFPTIFLSV